MAKNGSYLFSVVFSMNTAVYETLCPGMTFRCCCEAFNKVDPDAVGVYQDKQLVGYACNSPETIIPGTISGSKLNKLISKDTVARVSLILIEERDFTNKQGVEQKRFIAEAYFIPVRSNDIPKVEVTVGGLQAAHTKKAQLVGEITLAESNNTPVSIPVTIRSTNGGYFIYREGDTSAASCGVVESPDETFKGFFANTTEVSGRVVRSATKNKTMTRYVVEVTPSETRMNDFYPLIDSAIERCVGQARDLESKVKTMLAANFSDAAIKAVINQMPAAKSVDSDVPKPKTIYSQETGTNLADVISYMMMGKTVQLVGEKGSGKNTLVETACWLLNRPLCRVQGSSELDKLDILGSPSLKDGCTSFELSTMLQTLQNDGIVVIDEANTIRPDVMVLLHSLTDSARSVNIPGYGMVRMGPHACLIYTLNEDYIGTSEMNAATIDRGPRLIIEQETNMGKLLKKACPDAPDNLIDTCVSIAKEMRKAVRESGTLAPENLTVRGYIDALAVSQYIPLKRALIQNVANKAQSIVERNAMETIISSFCA